MSFLFKKSPKKDKRSKNAGTPTSPPAPSPLSANGPASPTPTSAYASPSPTKPSPAAAPPAPAPQPSTPAARLAELRAAVRLTPELAARLLEVPMEVPTGWGELSEAVSIVKQLGQGQMSSVYQASRRSDGAPVVLKVLNLALIKDSERALVKAATEV